MLQSYPYQIQKPNHRDLDAPSWTVPYLREELERCTNLFVYKMPRTLRYILVNTYCRKRTIDTPYLLKLGCVVRYD